MLPRLWGKHVSAHSADMLPQKTRKHGTRQTAAPASCAPYPLMSFIIGSG
jgi:hypothetical protein